MEQRTWTELPAGLRAAVEAVTGPVLEAESVETRRGETPFVAALTTGTGTVFAKGAPTKDEPGAEQRRRETVVAPIVASVAAPLIGHVDDGGWEVLLFTHIPQGNAELSPGSKDLGPFAATLRVIQQLQAPAGLALPSLADQWTKPLSRDKRALLSGDTLIHHDLVPANVMRRRAPHGQQILLVDWGQAVLGPAWAEFAGLYPGLLVAGHHPAGARQWLNQFPAWRRAPRLGVRAYVSARQAQCARVPEQVARWESLLDT